MTTALTVSKERASEVTNEIKRIKSSLVDNMLYLGELLSEARANSYPELLGFQSFGEWLESSGLDMSERQAYYLVKIVDNSRALGIDRDLLQASKLSKLKEIFALDPAVNAEQIKELVAQSADMTLDKVRTRVNEIRQKGGLEATRWCNFRVTDTQAEMIANALEMARMLYGQVVLPDGEVREATDGTLLADVIAPMFLDEAKMQIREQQEDSYAIIDAE
jgi:hypothetical protein